MKIAVCSDLHLEFGPFEDDHAIFTNPLEADTLILSGDILVAELLREGVSRYMKDKERIINFFDRVCSFYKNVVYVMGNHEHYHGDFAHTANRIHAGLIKYDNLHFLDNAKVKIDDVTFVGGTMWTDMNKENPETLYHIRHRMNDFRGVHNSNRMTQRTVPLYAKNPNGSGEYLKDANGYMIKEGEKIKEEPSIFSPEDAVAEHKKFLAFLKEAVADETNVVVCTHHTPSHQSCHPKYKHDKDMNGGYHSDLEDLILSLPQIKLWTHGHTHEKFDYNIGTTRVLCNPRGYINYEEMANTFVPHVVTI
jgi:Icc-related predicted phosphoesterase